MAPFPISLYGNNSNGYLTLMGQYATHTSYRYSRILAYLSKDVPYDDTTILDDPPWKRNLSDLTPPGHDEISLLLYVPVHQDETLTVYGEMLHLHSTNGLVKVAEQVSTDYAGSSATDRDASKPVHFTDAGDVWRHARIEFNAFGAIGKLKDYLANQGTGQYYLFRLRMISQHGSVVSHREENGYLLME